EESVTSRACKPAAQVRAPASDLRLRRGLVFFSRFLHAWRSDHPTRHARRADSRSASSLPTAIPRRHARHRRSSLVLAIHLSIAAVETACPISGEISAHLGQEHRFATFALDKTTGGTGAGEAP